MEEKINIPLDKYDAKKEITKILSLFSFILLILVLLILIITPAANGYEISIYNAYPWYFWLFFITVNFIAIMILMKETFKETNTNQWILGFSIFWLGNLIILLLPVFRGYCFYGGPSCDIFSHYGWIKEITNSGYISAVNFYPIIHIFVKYISDLLGVSVSEILNFIPALFSILYPIFMFLLARTISRNKGQTILITSLSLPLIFSFYHLTIHPAYFSFVFLPLLLYSYYKRISSEKKFGMTIILLTICFFIVFFHPITTLFSILIILIFIVFTFLFKKSKLFSIHNSVNFDLKNEINFFQILVISFLTWYAYHGWGINSIISIIRNLIYGSEFTIVKEYLSTLSISNITFFQTIELFVIRYGAITIYILIALICLALIIKNYIITKQINNLEFLYGIQLIVIFLVSILMIVSNFIENDPFRVFRFFVMIASIFSGLVIYQILNKSKKEIKPNILFHLVNNKMYFHKNSKFRPDKNIILCSLSILLLILITGIGIYSLYPSPISYEVNRQFTYMEFTGSTWVVENRNINLQISGDVGFNLLRMEHYINGVSNGDKRIKNEILSTPTHFRYLLNETVSQTFNYTSTYLITTQNGKQAVYAFPENIRQFVHQWTDEDFIKLNNDQTSNKIFVNGGFECWLI